MTLGTLSSVDYIIANGCGDFVEHHSGYRYGFAGLHRRTQMQCAETKDTAKRASVSLSHK